MSDTERDLTEAKHPLDPLQYPTNNIVAVIDTARQTQDAVDALERVGFPETEIGVGCGAELADRLSETTGRSGFADMAMRFSATLGLPNEEAEARARYERAMRDGHYVVAVLVTTDERKEQARQILAAHGARDLGYFGRFVIERLRPHR